MRTTSLSLLRLFGSLMMVSFGLTSIFVPGFANGGLLERVYLTLVALLDFGMGLVAAGGAICLVPFLLNKKAFLKAYLSFMGVIVGLFGLMIYWYSFEMWYSTLPKTFSDHYAFNYVVPRLGLCLTSLGILIVFTASAVQFRIMPRLLFVLVPAIVWVSG